MNMKLKAQSAMEYLITYGWAILIITLIVGALFTLGVLTNPIGSSVCVAGSGYYCSGLAYSHSTGNLAVTIGQSTGVNWANSILIFAVQGAPMTANSPKVGATDTNSIGGLISSYSIPVTWIAAQTAPIIVGTSLQGTIWACYITGNAAVLTDSAGTCSAAPAGQTIYYTQIARLNARAT